MNELHLFAGAGGGILGGIILGHTTVCAVEIEPYCQKVLLQRQRDGILMIMTKQHYAKKVKAGNIKEIV